MDGFRNVRRGRCCAPQVTASQGLVAAEAKDRIRVVDTLAAPRDVDMAVEAVSERLALKQRGLWGLRETLNEGVILATNTSSISTTKIVAASAAGERLPGRG